MIFFLDYEQLPLLSMIKQLLYINWLVVWNIFYFP